MNTPPKNATCLLLSLFLMLSSCESLIKSQDESITLAHPRNALAIHFNDEAFKAKNPSKYDVIIKSYNTHPNGKIQSDVVFEMEWEKTNHEYVLILRNPKGPVPDTIEIDVISPSGKNIFHSEQKWKK